MLQWSLGAEKVFTPDGVLNNGLQTLLLLFLFLYYIIWYCLEILMAWKVISDFLGINFGLGIFRILFEALGIFWGFYFGPHLIIPVTSNPEYPRAPAPGGL